MQWSPSEMVKQAETLSHPRDEIDSPIGWASSRVFLGYAIATLLAASASFVVAIYIFAPDQAIRALGPLLLSLVAVAGWIFLSRGKAQVAFSVLAYGSWVGVTGIAFFTGGVQAPAVVSYPVIILMIGWLSSVRATLAFTGLIVATILGFIVAESSGFLPVRQFTPPAMNGLIQIIISILAAVLAIHLVRAYQNRLKDLHRAIGDLTKTDAALKESEYRWKFALEGSGVGVWDWNIERNTLVFSSRWKEMLGYSDDEIGNGLDECEKRYHPDDKADALAELQAYLDGKTAKYEIELRVLCKDGKYKWVLDRGMVVSTTEDGKPLRMIGTYSDITERMNAQEVLRDSEARSGKLASLLRLMCDNVPDMIWAKDLEQRYVFANQAMCAQLLMAVDTDEPRGKTDMFFAMRERERCPENPQWHTFGELCQDSDVITLERGETSVFEESGNVQGKLLVLEVHKTPFVDDNGTVIGTVGSGRDITERKQMEAQVQQLAFYDPLTLLPNRRLLNDRLSQAMAVSKRSSCYGAVMFLDLDNFKSLNDLYGHASGDLLLIEAAQRLSRCVREADTVARFGGDEFVVMINELAADRTSSGAQARLIAEKIRATLSEPYRLTVKREGETEIHHDHHCTVSIGVALFIDHLLSQDDILLLADTAMYQAKEDGRNTVRFHEPQA
jgi:diguanylate cyclase (GGDEF)-like protein/PAS domain S-box-containing protein